MEPRSRFLSFVSIKVFARPGSLRSNPKMAPSQFNFSLPLAPCPLRSFFPSLDVLVYEARLYPYFFSLRGDADLTVKDFLGNWTAFITLFLKFWASQPPLEFAFYKRHPGGIVLLHSQILVFSRDLSFLDFMHLPTPSADGDQSRDSEVAKVEGKKPETKGVLTSQPSKVSSCPAMKIGPNASHHMISPPFLSHR